MEQMRLLGLDDRIGAIDAGSIAVDQIGNIIKSLPPEKWGEAAKSLPEAFVTQICKQGAAGKASALVSEYGPSIGAGILTGAVVSSLSSNTALALASGAAASILVYMLTQKSQGTNA